MNDWKTRFREQFVGEKSGFPDFLEPHNGEILESFIESEVRKAKEEQKEEIREWVKNNTHDFDGAVNVDGIIDAKELLDSLK